MATPSWQINLGGQHFDPERGEWITETNIADWAKPYVTPEGEYKGYKQREPDQQGAARRGS